MFLLQSDFSRHSLVNLLGPAELRMFIISHAQISLNHTKCRLMYSIVLTQSSGPTPSGSLEGKHRCGETMLGGSKGIGPLGRRAGVKALPEKGRQGAVSGARRTLEGGKRSCSPSKETREG
jgi:hypothetical protein